MMSDVGINAGLVLDHMGTPAEISAFFALIDRYKSKSADGALDLVTDRLFRRTVSGEQLDALEIQLAESQRILKEVPIAQGFWDEYHLLGDTKKVDRTATNAAEAFRRVYDSLTTAISMARNDEQLLGYIRPIYLMAWEGPKCHEHQSMPLEDFEKPDIRPIWLE
jgi:hypothetical protein